MRNVASACPDPAPGIVAGYRPFFQHRKKARSGRGWCRPAWRNARIADGIPDGEAYGGETYGMRRRVVKYMACLRGCLSADDIDGGFPAPETHVEMLLF